MCEWKHGGKWAGYGKPERDFGYAPEHENGL